MPQMQNEQKKNTSTPLKWLGGGAAMLLLKGKAILSLLHDGFDRGICFDLSVGVCYRYCPAFACS